ncbi:UNKNOWN [Stylonychia lemnae]|uniref:Uncharacterized protein n=1 Tax=Stylonychia lemnae TaxID=5949 RepID=A0A077ZYR8_STYLE|nr:UNKNOWN [Stylonychia lemnae]|eukprot:CDW75050.1 UNKNOWN [Stylonychia lemnae]
MFPSLVQNNAPFTEIQGYHAGISTAPKLTPQLSFEINQNDTFLMILAELKELNMNILNMQRIQQQQCIGLANISQSIQQQQTCMQCNQFTSDTQSCCFCYKRMCQYCQRNNKVGYHNCNECKILYCSSHQSQCLKCSMFYCTKCSPKLQTTGICAQCLNSQQPIVQVSYNDNRTYQTVNSQSRNIYSQNMDFQIGFNDQVNQSFNSGQQSQKDSMLNLSQSKFYKPQELKTKNARMKRSNHISLVIFVNKNSVTSVGKYAGGVAFQYVLTVQCMLKTTQQMKAT